MIGAKVKTAKMKILERLDEIGGPLDEAALCTAISIDEKEMRQIVKSIGNEVYTYEESLVGMGLVREIKMRFREPKYAITDKGRFVLRYIWNIEREEML